MTALELARRKQAEAALLESEARFRCIFNSVNEGIFIHDPVSGVIVDVNQRVEELYGYTRDEILQSRVELLSSSEPPYTTQEAREWLRKAVEQGPQLFEWRAKHKDGYQFWVEVNLRHTLFGAEPRVLATMRDVTGRKRAEAGFRQMSERLVLAVRAADVGIWDLDVPSNRLLWDEVMFRLYGLPPEQFNGTYEAWQAGVHPGDRKRLRLEAILSLADDDDIAELGNQGNQPLANDG